MRISAEAKLWAMDLLLSPVHSRAGVHPQPEAMCMQHSQLPPGGATCPSPEEVPAQASDFKSPHFRPNLLPGLLGSSA